MKYQIDDKLKPGATLLYGLQWWIVTIPAIITMGAVIGKVHFGADAVAQALYMQKMFFVSGLTLLVQVLFGHKLPLVVGPASVLLIGILASLPASVPAIYTAIAIGGIIIALIASFGLLKYFQKVFTPRVIIVIMLLIPLTLGPTIINLIFVNEAPALFNLLFGVVLCVLLLLANRLLRGIWKSATLILGIIAGTLIHHLILGSGVPAFVEENVPGVAENTIFIRPEFDVGVTLAFLFCAVALIINEVGSIEAVGQMLRSEDMERRNRRGVGIIGLSHLLSGVLGTIGPIDYSTSTGIMASTRCASRYTFVPTAILLVVCAFIPPWVRWLLTIPSVVMGTVLLYVMTCQFAAGFQMIVRNNAAKEFNGGAVIGFSLMIALLVSFMPSGLSEQIPALVRPILCNGFVMGVMTVLVMEHLICRERGNRE